MARSKRVKAPTQSMAEEADDESDDGGCSAASDYEPATADDEEEECDTQMSEEGSESDDDNVNIAELIRGGADTEVSSAPQQEAESQQTNSSSSHAGVAAPCSDPPLADDEGFLVFEDDQDLQELLRGFLQTDLYQAGKDVRISHVIQYMAPFCNKTVEHLQMKVNKQRIAAQLQAIMHSLSTVSKATSSLATDTDSSVATYPPLATGSRQPATGRWTGNADWISLEQEHEPQLYLDSCYNMLTLDTVDHCSRFHWTGEVYDNLQGSRGKLAFGCEVVCKSNSRIIHAFVGASNDVVPPSDPNGHLDLKQKAPADHIYLLHLTDCSTTQEPEKLTGYDASAKRWRSRHVAFDMKDVLAYACIQHSSPTTQCEGSCQ